MKVLSSAALVASAAAAAAQLKFEGPTGTYFGRWQGGTGKVMVFGEASTCTQIDGSSCIGVAMTNTNTRLTNLEGTVAGMQTQIDIMAQSMTAAHITLQDNIDTVQMQKGEKGEKGADGAKGATGADATAHPTKAPTASPTLNPLKITGINNGYATVVTSYINTNLAAWTDRSYAFQEYSFPTSGYDYHSSPMSTGAKPCSTEGGGQFTTNKATSVIIGCANHCGGAAVVTGAASYSPVGRSGVHQGGYALSNHGGSPVDFFEADVGAGTHTLCCNCWATGLFLPKVATLPSVLPSITDVNSGIASIRTVSPEVDLNAWTDRSYAFQEYPFSTSDLVYYSSPMSTGAKPCSTEGGMKFTTDVATSAIIGCANHAGQAAAVTQNGGPATYSSLGRSGIHQGGYALSNHGGQPVDFFKVQVQPGTHTLCCNSWATGVFLKA